MSDSAETNQKNLDRAMLLVRTIGDANLDYGDAIKELRDTMPSEEVGGLVDALVMLVGSVALAGSRVGLSAQQLIEDAYRDLATWQIERPDEPDEPDAP